MLEAPTAPKLKRKPPGAPKGKPQRKKPSGAYKLLVTLLFGRMAYLERTESGYVRLHSNAKLGQLLNVDTKYINKWFLWLEDQGFIESLAYTQDRRACQFKLRRPRNI